MALLSLLIVSFISFYINLWSIAETVKSRCSFPSLWTINKAISPLTGIYVLFEKHLWLASRVISPSWRYTLSDNHETIAIDTPEDQSHDRYRDKFFTIYTTSSNLIYPESMSDMNDGDSGKKRKTGEGESGKFYLLPSFSTIPPSNNTFRFELCFRFLSLLYSPIGNEEEKNGGQRKRQNTETMDGTSLPVPKKSGVFPKDLEATGPSKGRKAGKSKMKARKANGSKNPVPENEPDGVYPGAFEAERESPD